jgi:hypothetical protein
MEFTCLDCGPEALPPIVALAFIVMALGIGFASTLNLHHLRGSPMGGGSLATRRTLSWMGYLGATLLILVALRGRIPFW